MRTAPARYIRIVEVSGLNPLCFTTETLVIQGLLFAPIAPAIIVLSLFVAEEIKIKVVLKIISLLCATTPRFRFGAICVNTSQRSFHIPPCKVTI